MGRNDLIKYLCIPSWDDHQEKRTNRDGKVWRPPWIKVKCDNADDYAYGELSIRQRGLLMELWKLAGKLDNQIPNDPLWISRACQSVEDISEDLNVLISRGFIQPSVMITEGLRKDVVSEIETELEIEESPNGDLSDSARRVFEHWKVERSKKRCQYTSGRKRTIKARLKNFTEAELTRVIDSVALDPWEDRPRYDDFSHLMSNDEKVERWLLLADAPPEKRAGLSVKDILAMGEE